MGRRYLIASTGSAIPGRRANSVTHHRGWVHLGHCIDGVWILADNAEVPAEALAAAQKIWTPEVIVGARALAEEEYASRCEAMQEKVAKSDAALAKLEPLLRATNLTAEEFKAAFGL
jgi:hypothetical protein